ncbi:MAG: InlB B-repeat-containing protein, partial [Treponema sp.]|nr:InlB B-repeat-containing protein [Treponema sp.]
AGLCLEQIFEGWYLADKQFSFDTPITADTVLKARWKSPDPVMEISDNIDFNSAVNKAKNLEGIYTLALNSEASFFDTQILNNKNLKLTIFCISGEEEAFINHYESGILFDLDGEGIELTIGKNISLAGSPDSNTPLVRVQNGAHFIMLEGSKITENTSADPFTFGSTVYLDSGRFTMKGGTITGNVNNSAAVKSGIVYSAGASVVSMEGGSISGNSSGFADVLLFRESMNDSNPQLVFSGDAQTDNVQLSITSLVTSIPRISVASGWIGENIRLNLHVTDVEEDYDIDNFVLNGRPVLYGTPGHNINRDDAGRFTLGKIYNKSGRYRNLRSFYQMQIDGSVGILAPVPKTWTISFDSCGGSNVPDQFVNEIIKTVNPGAPAISPPINAGMYAGADPKTVFVRWYLDNEDTAFDFRNYKIKEDITLKAKWAYPEPVRPAGSSNDFTAAISYARNNPGTFTIALDTDLELSVPLNIDKNNLRLIITGLGGERKIAWTGTQILFDVGLSGRTGIELVIGNNITLAGKSGSTYPLVRVQYKSEFIMLNGSKISGNTANVPGISYGSTVYIINEGRFTMKGGTITGNANNHTNGNLNYFGIVHISGGSEFNMEGGIIGGNTGKSDVSLYNAAPVIPPTFRLSGTATINDFKLGIRYGIAKPEFFPSITVDSGWTGSIKNLDLYTESGVEANLGNWVDRTVLKGNVNADRISRIRLGNFAILGKSQPITAAYKLDAGGKLTAGQNKQQGAIE